jgi:hypothetical protein
MHHQLPSGDSMRKTLLPLVFISSLLASAAHSAEQTLRPGLWEMTTTSDLLKLVPLIPPDQMQNLMSLARQNGFDVPEIKNGAALSRTCITQAMAEQRNLPGFYQNRAGCTAKNAIHTGNKYKLDYVCASSQLKGNGTAEGTITSPESFSGQTQFDGVAQGNPVNEHADISGRWITASCGAVKSAQ